MKKLYTLFLLILFLPQLFSQEIKDLIAPLRLTAGEVDTVLICDIFYSTNYNLSFIENSSIDVKYVEIKYLILKPKNAAEGLEIIHFKQEQNEYSIPCIIEKKAKYLFRWSSKAPNQKVNLFGSFNSWNRESHSMIYNQMEGAYELLLSLDPGRYEYKFFVEGNESLDQLNKDSISNGLGGYNSVISIKPFHSGKVFLHVLGKEQVNEDLKLSYYFEKDLSALEFKEDTEAPERTEIKIAPPLALQKSSVIALIDNKDFPDKNISIEGNKITLVVSPDMIIDDPVIRVAVNDGGQTTRFQTVFFFNGEIAGSGSYIDDPASDRLLKSSFYKSTYDNILYALMVDRFSDGNKENSVPVKHPKLLNKANYMGGDLQGIINKIEDGYFTKLGINTLWLSPVIDNTDSAYQEYPKPHRYYTGYHGYWPVDPIAVEERFGDMALLKKLVETAHQNNMKVLLDYVANHIHIEHPYWNQHRDWFGDLMLPDGRRNLRLWDEHRLTTWFEPFMPKFDFQNSKTALDSMTDNAVWWIKETEVDGFRHDAVKHVPNEYWRLLTQKLKKEFQGNKLIYQIGETFGSYDLVSSYVTNGQLDAQFNFLLYDTAIPTFTGSTSFASLDEQMQRTFDVYGVNHLMGNIMDSHDKVRFMAYADDDVNDKSGDPTEMGWTKPPNVDKASSYKKLKQYIAYLSTIPGLPIIYYGDEIGMTGAGDPDNRRMMRFDDEIEELEKQTLMDVSRLIKTRSDHSALRYGDFLTLQADDKVYAYIRSDLNERILVVINKSEEMADLKLNIPEFYNLTSSEFLAGSENSKLKINISPVTEFTLEGLGYLILKLK